MSIRVDISRPRLLRNEPAIRVYRGDRIVFARLVEWPGGRVVQDGTAVWVEITATVDGVRTSGDPEPNGGP